MSTREEFGHTRLGQSAVRVFVISDRVNQLLIEHIDSAAWRAAPPARPPAKVRTIAAVFTHIHNIRVKWVRLTTPHVSLPALLNRAYCTPEQARTALAESAACCEQMLAEALDESGEQIKTFRRDGWARPWPVGPEMLCYMVSHEAHHRGQVCMLAHQLGFQLPAEVTARMWNWETLWKLPAQDQETDQRTLQAPS